MQSILTNAILPTVAGAVANRVARAVEGKPQRATKQRKQKKKVVKREPKLLKGRELQFVSGSAPSTYGTQVRAVHHQEQPVTIMKANKFGKLMATSAVRMSGRLLLTALNYNATLPYVDVWKTPINPLAFPGSTLFDRAQDYQKFKFTSIKLDYVTSCATGFSNGLCFYSTDDPEFTFRGNPGSITYFQSIIGSDNGAVVTPVWMNCSMTKNFLDDGSEYYMQPDIQGEERFTVQGRLGAICTNNQSTVNLNQIFGHVYATYEITCWSPAVGADNQIGAAINVPSYLTSSSASGLRATITDTAAIGATIYVANPGTSVDAPYTSAIAALLPANTLFRVISTYTMGYLKAFNTYYAKTPVTWTTTGPLNFYTTIEDASAQSSENQVSSSTFGQDRAPDNAVSFWSTLGAVNGPEITRKLGDTQKEQKEIDTLRDEISALKLKLQIRQEPNPQASPKDAGRWVQI